MAQNGLKLTRLFIPAAMAGIIFFSCGEKKENDNKATDSTKYTESVVIIEEEKEQLPEIDPLPPGVGRRIKVKNVGAFSMVFNDSNNYQLEQARRLGINPISDLGSAYFTGRPLVKVYDCEYYKIDSLKHSLPYLVPEAADLLAEIGRTFNDSLKARGGDSHKIKVTSLLRTPETVSKLRRVNVNATDSSTHQYATTFDISYTNFYCTDSTRLIYQGDLKNLLAEVLYDLREQRKCLVKYERKTGCFHVTVNK